MKTPNSMWWRIFTVAGLSGSLLLAGQLISVPSIEAACKGSSTGSSWDHNAAVRDNNTGLVWEKAPDGNRFSWFDALGPRANKTVGNTAGWRLP